MRRQAVRLTEDIPEQFGYRTQPGHLENPPQSQSLGFLDLPPEIRLMVYKYVASEPHIIYFRPYAESRWMPSDTHATLIGIHQAIDAARDHSLLHTCDLIKYEAADILGKRAVFISCPIAMLVRAWDMSNDLRYSDLRYVRWRQTVLEPSWLQTLRSEYYARRREGGGLVPGASDQAVEALVEEC